MHLVTSDPSFLTDSFDVLSSHNQTWGFYALESPVCVSAFIKYLNILYEKGLACEIQAFALIPLSRLLFRFGSPFVLYYCICLYSVRLICLQFEKETSFVELPSLCFEDMIEYCALEMDGKFSLEMQKAHSKLTALFLKMLLKFYIEYL